MYGAVTKCWTGSMPGTRAHTHLTRQASSQSLLRGCQHRHWGEYFTWHETVSRSNTGRL